MITSSNNAKVKQVVQWQTKAKERRKDHVFLAEGVRMCEEAPVKSVREVYLTEELEQKLRRNAQNGDTAFWDKLQQTGYETVSPEVFAKMADTQTPQGILTVLEPTAFLIGNEGNGLTKEISDQAGQYLKIPMEGKVESLNASIAAALLMYEAHRQRNL